MREELNKEKERAFMFVFQDSSSKSTFSKPLYKDKIFE
jgi:hypothetical protein